MGQYSAYRISRAKQANNLERLSAAAQSADIREALAAVLETTRREWMLPLTAISAADEPVVKRSRIARPSIRYSRDATRGSAWSARIGGQERVDNIVRFAESDNTPEGAS
jgi:hypothetical protein